MIPLRIGFLIVCINNLITATSYAQQLAGSGQAENPAVAYAKAIYYERVDVRKSLFSGPEYPPFSKEQYPYFQTDSARLGTVVYDSLAVTGVRLLYDIQSDQLVMQYPESPLQFLLDTARIAGFTLGGHTFHRFAADSARPTGLATGFYDMLLSAGPLQLVARRQKQRQEEIRERRKVPYYRLRNRFYIITNKTALPVNKKKELYNLRPEKKKELTAHMRRSKLSFKKEKEAYLLAAVRYLNTIL